MAGDMNAALFKQDVQRAKQDIKDAKHQSSSKMQSRAIIRWGCPGGSCWSWGSCQGEGLLQLLRIMCGH